MRAALVALALWAAPLSAAPPFHPQKALEAGQLAYQRHEYGRVVENVYPLLYPSIELGREEDVVEAHKLLGLSYFFLEKKPEAEQEVVSLLQLRPNYQLNPVVEAPVAVTFFNAVRDRQEVRLRELKERQREEAERARREEERRRAEARARAERIYIEKQIVRRSRLVAMLPFGIGQLQNGHRGSAIAFGVVEGVLGGLSLAVWIADTQLFPGGVVQRQDQGLAESILTLQVVSGAAFWGVAIAGIIEAQVRLKPQSVITREIAPPKKVSFIPGPGVIGLGIGGTF